MSVSNETLTYFNRYQTRNLKVRESCKWSDICLLSLNFRYSYMNRCYFMYVYVLVYRIQENSFVLWVYSYLESFKINILD